MHKAMVTIQVKLNYKTSQNLNSIEFTQRPGLNSLKEDLRTKVEDLKLIGKFYCSG